MIEKYFKLGVRLKWNKPPDNVAAMDASFCLSKGNETQMIYDGMDEHIMDAFTNISTFGFFKKGMQIQYKWLDYAPGRIATVPMGPYDILTGYMSGCIIAHWTDKGIKYSGHIGTVDGNDQKNRDVKRKFSFDMKSGTTGFNPAAAWNPGEISAIVAPKRPVPETRIFGMVTTSGTFYSILTFKLVSTGGVGEWCVGGIKQVAPISHDALKLQLLR